MELPGFGPGLRDGARRPARCIRSLRYAVWTRCRKGAVVGTSSLRRQVLLQALRPDLKH